MICATLSASTNAGLADLLRTAADHPADLHGLLLDGLVEEPDVGGLLAASSRPVLASCLSKKAGGEFEGDDAARRDILLRAIRAGARYVEADADDVPYLAPRKESALLIAGMRDLRGTPHDLEERLHSLARLPADWISFAVAVRHPGDNLAVFEAIAASPKPCVGVGLGPEGLMTVVLGPALGSKITYGVLERDDPFSPCPVTVRELSDLYRVRNISEQTTIYGLLGNPAPHDATLAHFNRGFQTLDLDAVFLPFQTTNAENFLGTIPQGIDLQGLSVTTPHKLTALAWAEAASEAARRIGAANTLTLRPEGWRADNSECLALFEALKHAADAAGVVLTNQPALVMGSGATARVIGLAFTLLGCRVTVAGRLEERTRRLAADMNWEAENWSDAGRRDWRAVGNGTPVGMFPDADATPFPACGWKPGMFAFDAVHQPADTRFMREARAAGASVMSIEDMFLRQTAGQFRMWTGFGLPDMAGE